MIRRLLALAAIAGAVAVVSTPSVQAAARPEARPALHAAPHAAAALHATALTAARPAVSATPQSLWCYDPYWGWYLCALDYLG